MSKIVLGGLPDFTVPLPDPATDAERIYRPRAFTKTLEAKWDDALAALAALESKLEAKDKVTSAEKDKYVRLLCNCLNILLVGGEIEAGDHIWALREAGVEGTSQADIRNLFLAVLAQSDPT